MLGELDLNQADAFDLDYAVQTNHSRSRTMKANVGSTDRIIRIVLGLVIIGWGAMNANWLGAIGLIPLATAFMRWCPAYLPFGISTCKTE
ncbi:MAG: hypothetical protein RIQ43_1350 [Pseudomonadota bacterium]|jgi:hypothetical protein